MTDVNHLFGIYLDLWSNLKLIQSISLRLQIDGQTTKCGAQSGANGHQSPFTFRPTDRFCSRLDLHRKRPCSVPVIRLFIPLVSGNLNMY